MSFKGIGAIILFVIVMFSLIRKNILQSRKLKRMEKEKNIVEKEQKSS